MPRKTESVAKRPMQIGQIAKLAGVGVETIRFYERQGILPKPERKAASGYRQFKPDIVDRIRFIKKVQDLGFSLKEAGNLASSKGIHSALDRIARRIQELEELRRELRNHLRKEK